MADTAVTGDASAPAPVAAVAVVAPVVDDAVDAPITKPAKKAPGPKRVPKHLDAGSILTEKRARVPSGAQAFAERLKALKAADPSVTIIVGEDDGAAAAAAIDRKDAEPRVKASVRKLYHQTRVPYLVIHCRDGTYKAKALGYWQDATAIANSEWKARQGLVTLLENQLEDLWRNHAAVWAPAPYVPPKDIVKPQAPAEVEKWVKEVVVFDC